MYNDSDLSATYELLTEFDRCPGVRRHLALARCKHLTTKIVVCNRVHSKLSRDQTFRAAFLHEGKHALRLAHPNVAGVHEVIAKDRQCQWVTSFVEGQSLARVLAKVGRRGVPWNLHLYILSEVLAGLEHAHKLCAARGGSPAFIHGSLAPSRIFVTYEGRIQILDYGFRSIADKAWSDLHHGGDERHYLAPEQRLGLGVDSRADLYAVGVMLWEASTQRVRRTDGGSYRRAAPSSDSLAPGASPGVSADAAVVLRKALASRPQDRYANAFELHRDVGPLAAQCTEPGTAELLGAFMCRHFHEEIGVVERAIQARNRGLPRWIAASPRVVRRAGHWFAGVASRSRSPSVRSASQTGGKHNRLGYGLVLGVVGSLLCMAAWFDGPLAAPFGARSQAVASEVAGGPHATSALARPRVAGEHDPSHGAQTAD